ncbi:hypothetical protein [Nocardiopsis coralliicola]
MSRNLTPVLLPGALEPAGGWDGLYEALDERFAPPLVADAPEPDTPPYAVRHVAAVSLQLAAFDFAAPVLIARGDAGPLLPAVGAALSAAHRPPAGYVFVDALMPRPGIATRAELRAAQCPGMPADETAPSGFDTEPLPPVGDWPDAPCGYVLSDPDFTHCAHLAGLRGWPVADVSAAAGGSCRSAAELVAELLVGLIGRL